MREPNNGTGGVNFSVMATAIICLLMWSVADVTAGEDDSFHHTTPSGLTCIITKNGLTAIRVGDRTIAKGRWRLDSSPMWAAEKPVPSVTPPTLSPGPIESSDVKKLSAEQARVRHVHANLTVVYDYIFEGDDLRIAARVENPNRQTDLRAAAFGGLEFVSPEELNGLMMHHPTSRLRKERLALFHPSPETPIGASYVTGKSFGIGLCPVTRETTPTLLRWQKSRGNETVQLSYVVSASAKAEGARTYQLLIRLSDQTDWKYLLGPWRRRLAAMFGEVRYPYDIRPIIYHPVRTQPVKPGEGSGTTLWNCAPGPWGESKTPDNPLGYAHGEVRFDRPQYVRDYVDGILPDLKKANARGLVFRQLGGYDPKGLEYAAMFHMAPPSVHENVKNFIAGPLRESGLIVGVTGRPDRWPVHTTIHRCEWLDAAPHIQKHLRHMWHCRLRESIRKLGAGMFLMEDFGTGVGDLRMMQYFRQVLNEREEHVPTYVPHLSDAMLFYSPCIIPAQIKDGQVQLEPDLSLCRIVRWLVPGAVLYGNVESDESKNVLKVTNFLDSHRMGAMISEDVLPEVASELGELNMKWAGKPDVEPVKTPLQISCVPPSATADIDSGDPDAEFTYSTDDGISFLVTADGLNEVSLDDRTLVEGEWKTLSPGDSFGKTPIQKKGLRRIDDRTCRVTHVHESMRTTFTYRFEGEDVVIRAHVENNHASVPIDITAFGQLTFHFQGEADRDQLSKHSKWGWLVHPKGRNDLGHMHPGWSNRIAGSYGADEQYGVGATPLHTGLTRTLTNWQGGWGSKTRRLRYSAQKPIPPGGARTFYLKLRLSTNRNWKHLMEPYREYFDALHSTKPHYNVDHRLATQQMISTPGGPWRSDTNPLAYHRHGRIDTPEGARRWAERTVAIMNKANGTGPIVWGQCGYQPRGMLFRSDFDLLPRCVAENWEIIDKIFKQAGRQYGVTVGRAGVMNYRWRWETDNILVLDPENLQHLKSMERRYRRMMDRGVTMFYLDAFGRRLRSVKAMRYYRHHVLSPDILTYCEHPCDAILPYSGVRSGVRHSGRKGLHIMWGLDRFWYIMNWVMEDFGSQNYAHLKSWPPTVKKKVGEKFGNPVYERVRALNKEQEYRWMFRHRMGVLEASHKVSSYAEMYRKVQDEFMTPDGKWREDIEPIDLPGEDRYKQERKKRQQQRQNTEEDKLDTLLGE
ncbi:MAG: hypothetical protein ACLFWL_14405 [Candidatus Brocadiia bacterium]